METDTEVKTKIKEILSSRHLYLEHEELFVPTYYQCTLKEKFYQNGGEELGCYDERDYSRLLGVPVSYVVEIVNNKPELLLWLHEKRSAEQEIDTLVSIAARKMINKMGSASTKDQAQVMNALSKFSTLVKPEKKVDPYDSLVENINDLSELEQELSELGFKKEDEIMFEAIEGSDGDSEEE